MRGVKRAKLFYVSGATPNGPSHRIFGKQVGHWAGLHNAVITDPAFWEHGRRKGEEEFQPASQGGVSMRGGNSQG